MKNLVFTVFIVIGTNALGQVTPRTAKLPTDFIPDGYVVFQQIQGDLNKDNQVDDVLIIKGTDKANFVKDEHRGELDRNRRGIIIALKNNDGYELALENRDCFSSENEDGGVYFPPELDVSIKKDNLLVHYGHGRYGHWTYNFRYQNSDFELIGYDSDQNRGPITETSVSINLMTKKMLIKEYVNQDAEEGGDEKFKATWKKFTLSKPIRLRDIADFDGFDVTSLLSFTPVLSTAAVAMPVSADTKAPTWAGEIPSSASRAIKAAFPFTADWLVGSPRIGATDWAIGALGQGKPNLSKYHVARVNFLDQLNMNRDGLVVLIEKEQRSGDIDYEVLDKSQLWLRQSTLAEASNWSTADRSVTQLDSYDTVTIAKGFAWLDSTAGTPGCNGNDEKLPCVNVHTSFQFQMKNDRLILIGNSLKLKRLTASDNWASIYSCSINYLTHTKLEHEAGSAEKKSNHANLQPLPLSRFVPFTERYGVGGLPDGYFCDRLLSAGDLAPK